MKPVDGQHRRFDAAFSQTPTDDHIAWCRNLLRSLAEDGIWRVPRSGLGFQRRGNTLVLIERDRRYDAVDQQHDYELNKRMFAKAGITITDET